MDIVTELSSKIYKEPLSSRRDSGQIRDLSNPLSILMLVIDFETEVSMNGIFNFLGNYTGIYANETVQALRKIGCVDEAPHLEKIIDIAFKAGMTRKEIQKNPERLPKGTSASFKDIHGNKWDNASDSIRDIEDNIDYREIYKAIDIFADENREYLENCLKEVP